MRALKIVNLVLLPICVLLQLIPYGLLVSSANIAIYYSYFDIIAWSNGIIGPFFCGLFTITILGMLIGSFFFKRNNGYYLLVLNIISWIAFLFSLMPLIFDAYTILGGVISAILLFCAESNMMIYNKTIRK